MGLPTVTEPQSDICLQSVPLFSKFVLPEIIGILSSGDKMKKGERLLLLNATSCHCDNCPPYFFLPCFVTGIGSEVNRITDGKKFYKKKKNYKKKILQEKIFLEIHFKLNFGKILKIHPPFM